VTTYDGPTLRAVRESMGVPLRRIARHAGMSHGHLSKVERGEYGRPVTPAIMAAYEKVTGVQLADAVAAVAERGEPPANRRGNARVWQPGHLSEMRRRSFHAAIGALTMGGHLGEPFQRLLDSTGRPLTPAPPSTIDVAHLTRLSRAIAALDLRYGGGLVSQLAKALLRWAVPMLDIIDVNEEVRRRAHTAIGELAHRAGWAAFDVAAHEPARTLFRLALYAAVRGDDINLRAHVLADVAAQHSSLGYHHDALEVLRLAEGDDRVARTVRMVVQGVKARTCAALGDVHACRRAVDAAERAHASADSTERGWIGALGDPALLSAITGHAVATLAERTGTESDRKDASERLTNAIDSLDSDTHARAQALCVARLAVLHLSAGDLDQAARWSRLTVDRASGIRSARLDNALAAIRITIVEKYPNEPVMCELLDEIGTRIEGPAEEPP
jgi:transcriptional regulator with XRE-family HTH domain